MSHVILKERSHDQLRHKFALWEEELRVHGGRGSDMTSRDVEELRTRIRRLIAQVKALDAEYQAIMDL